MPLTRADLAPRIKKPRGAVLITHAATVVPFPEPEQKPVRRPPVTVAKTSSEKRLAIAFVIALGMAGLVVMVLRTVR